MRSPDNLLLAKCRDRRSSLLFLSSNRDEPYTRRRETEFPSPTFDRSDTNLETRDKEEKDDEEEERTAKKRPRTATKTSR